MRICLLADATSVHTIKLCEYLIKKGHEIYVISLQNGTIEGVIVYSFHEKNLRVRSDISKLRYVTNVIKIRNLLKKIKPDILHAHYATSYGLLGTLMNFHPYVLSVWGSDIYLFPRKSIFHETLLKLNLSRADMILSTSNAMSAETSKYTKKEIMITPFGVDIEMFKPSGEKEQSKVIKIGIAKTLNYIYGIDYLIKAFKIVYEALIDEVTVELYIAGRGEHENVFRALAKELNIEGNVIFLGHLNKNQVAKFYQNIDFAVFPSLSESFGVAAVEAQACGKPVIVTEVGGLPEATKPGYSSLIVESKNEIQLAEAIEKLVRDRDLRNEMGSNGVEFVKQNFEVNSNLNIIENIYRSILKNNTESINYK